ncbi:hypothetical protein [Streptomyces ficellus]|uniref:Uncharacterized protein n=1 Tax=Streptomyces ficellus TaxID=1977088 RepID=A0A6I6FSY0_9ACTN|nr:hypothetical protein [Streptomyces ficellus]QGV80848.1 hypothetical protein EIZ62_23335 [Streptomyces ficellus]
MARTQSTCGARTKHGGRCQRLAMVGASRCNLHRGDWATYTIERDRQRQREQERARARKRPKR